MERAGEEASKKGGRIAESAEETPSAERPFEGWIERRDADTPPLSRAFSARTTVRERKEGVRWKPGAPWIHYSCTRAYIALWEEVGKGNLKARSSGGFCEKSWLSLKAELRGMNRKYVQARNYYT
ncbi:hypothetical protein KM043_008414 [Ampulex compressa]|nr:hypothetical protein KM043_008414 [Ampulex compressa]